MRIGFDYGTSNCAVAWMSEGQVRRLPLEGGDCYLPSTLFAPHRDAIADLLAASLPASSLPDLMAAKAAKPSARSSLPSSWLTLSTILTAEQRAPV